VPCQTVDGISEEGIGDLSISSLIAGCGVWILGVQSICLEFRQPIDDVDEELLLLDGARRGDSTLFEHVRSHD